MKMYGNVVELPGGIRRVVTINHIDEGQVLLSKTVDQLHHIHILDRSGSMAYEINHLIDVVRNTFLSIHDDDLISIIWFSSANQYRTLVKGAKKSAALCDLLDTLRSAVGATCFSDPLKELNLIVDELAPLCRNISVTLFTDGCPVVPWSVEEEERRIFAELTKLECKILAFNTVGFGNHYNQTLMLEMAQKSEYGSFFHVKNISDYHTVFNHNFEKISEMVMETIDIEVPDHWPVIYLSRSFTKMEFGGLSLTRSDKRKNQIFIIGPDDKHFAFGYQGVDYSTDSLLTTQPATILNFLYAYAYNMYYIGIRQEALDIVAKCIGDKALVDSHLSVFSFNEVSDHTEKLAKAVIKGAKYRLLSGSCAKDYLPADNALCVMDVLQTLQDIGAYYIPFSDRLPEYQRITKKSTDDFDLFIAANAEVRTPFADFVYNKQNLNVSIRFYINGTVKLNPKSAKVVNLEPIFKSGMFRNHTIIKDGALNMEMLEVLIPKGASEHFPAVCLSPAIEIVAFDKNGDTPEGVVFERRTLALGLLPIINRSYINRATTIDEIFETTKTINILEATQKLIGYHLETVKSMIPAGKKVGIYKEYTMAQIAVLEQHGIDKSGNYAGVSKSKPLAAECDSYQTRTMEFYIAGCSSWPAVKELYTRLSEKKKLTTTLQIMFDANFALYESVQLHGADLDTIDRKLCDALLKLQEECKRELLKKRALLTTLKMAKLLTGDWFPELISDGKGNWTYEKGGITMVAKAAYTTVYF